MKGLSAASNLRISLAKTAIFFYLFGPSCKCLRMLDLQRRPQAREGGVLVDGVGVLGLPGVLSGILNPWDSVQNNRLYAIKTVRGDSL